MLLYFLASQHQNLDGKSALTLYRTGIYQSQTTSIKANYKCRNLIIFSSICISLGNAVGAMYVREYFDESARKSANEMVQNIQSVFNEVLDEIDWMDNKTLTRAKAKAAAMTTHIAYPDELLDDKKLSAFYVHVNTTRLLFIFYL